MIRILCVFYEKKGTKNKEEIHNNNLFTNERLIHNKLHLNIIAHIDTIELVLIVLLYFVVLLPHMIYHRCVCTKNDDDDEEKKKGNILS